MLYFKQGCKILVLPGMAQKTRTCRKRFLVFLDRSKKKNHWKRWSLYPSGC